MDKNSRYTDMNLNATEYKSTRKGNENTTQWLLGRTEKVGANFNHWSAWIKIILIRSKYRLKHLLHSQRDALELNLTYRSNKILSKETNRWFSTQMWYLIHLWFHMQTAVYNNDIALLLFPADHSLSTEKKKWSGETHWCVQIHTGEKIICTDIRKSLCIILWSHIGHSVDMNLNRGRSKGGPSFVVIIIIFNIYTAQINIQEDVIKCALHVKLQASFFKENNLQYSGGENWWVPSFWHSLTPLWKILAIPLSIILTFAHAQAFDRSVAPAIPAPRQ